MAAGSTFTPIATTTLGSAQASYTFSSIPSTYTDLVLIINGTSSANGADIDFQFNGDTGTTYSYTALGGNGSSAASYRNSNATFIRCSTYSSMSTTNPNATIVYMQNYSNSTTYKTILSRDNNVSNGTTATTGLWRGASNAAINQMTIKCTGGNFATGTTLTLYGILAA